MIINIKKKNNNNKKHLKYLNYKNIQGKKYKSINKNLNLERIIIAILYLSVELITKTNKTKQCASRRYKKQ